MRLQILFRTMLRILLRRFGGFYTQILKACMGFACLSGRLLSTVGSQAKQVFFVSFDRIGEYFISPPMKKARIERFCCSVID